MDIPPEIKDGWMTIGLSNGCTVLDMNSVIQYSLSYELEKE